ncbi:MULTISPECIES: elongation factor P [Pseudothermotoga]|jgi:elongation factor P|uniref:Elongation factor P n=1 Tax=Pseudothermotoga lettingae (strain ATCC BAA-301 / DSM 14385 / NBRC 107922 / TMO) TaxID=416591 RepID=EFP_PSELT|nr:MULTISPECIES: elongation factor P [Pseudothermotoga]A8F7D2.1 RecName: Full=Elongation factor P; Short=EF-P [Pseudothermotoga lettingae TMO]ABV34066.1 translation elongation factor P [Pseudothermotoga lettingae TMO]KUK20069.1 MAG: Elongation factor P [Pseudothermotoga lettingae]MDI3494689.1 elongation factor [Pseudothermotoga sp.]MDK2884691.1 elongation factor [Pseudothermotoga sp.]GLI48995.1 elongation factor P [Pseudothermotoga lettingae TMO]
MVEVGDLKKGMVIMVNGEPHRVVDVSKHHMAMGRGIIRTKLKSVVTGFVKDVNFSSGERVEEANLSFRQAQFLYSDGAHYHFMALDDYEQYILSEEDLQDAKWYLIENLELSLVFLEDKPIGVQLPNVVTLKVVETEPSFKGDTVSGGGKPAVLETGLKINVPFFVETGEFIKVDTRTGEYVERA